MAIRLIFNPKVGWTGELKSKPITYREMHILNMSAHGYSNKEIAEALGIAYQTVKNNFHRLMKKLGAESSAHALLLAIESGVVSIEMISSEADESLPKGERDEARLHIKQEVEKVSKMTKDEAEKYMAEQNLRVLQSEEDD